MDTHRLQQRLVPLDRRHGSRPAVSRLGRTMALAVVACAGLIGVVPFAHASVIRAFAVNSGVVAISGSGGGCGACSLGTFDVNVTSGTVTGVNLTIPGLAAFNTLDESLGFKNSVWTISARNDSSDDLDLQFATAFTPASLMGFDGGALEGGDVSFNGAGVLYSLTGGSINPISVPEPPVLGIFGLGLGLLGLGLAWGKRQAARAI